MDGRYCNAIIRSGDVELESRGGEPSKLPRHNLKIWILTFYMRFGSYSANVMVF
jgi:hypothetical protein